MGSRWNAAAPWVAPGLLCGIALVQLMFAHFSGLSPWKGGGFGMFSTVDSPAARFLRVYLVTPQGDIPVMIPDNLREKGNELRTFATQQLADEFAEALAEGTWVELRMASAVSYYLSLLKLDGRNRSQDRLTADLGTHSQSAEEVNTFEKFNFVRMLKPNEPLDPRDTKIDALSIRLELWKYSFDKESQFLRAQKHIQATSSRSD